MNEHRPAPLPEHDWTPERLARTLLDLLEQKVAEAPSEQARRQALESHDALQECFRTRHLLS